MGIIIDTVSPVYHIDVFYPRYFQRMFNRPMERLTLDVEHTEHSLKLNTNYENMVIEFERTPTHMSAKVLKKDVTFMEFTQEHKLNFNAKKFFLTLKPTLHLHADSFLHKELCQFSTFTCFQEITGDVNIGVVAKGKKQISTKITIHKDTEEIYNLEVSNKGFPYKFIFKSPYVVPFFKYLRSNTWLTWMMPVKKSPFEVSIELHPGQKSLMVNTNIDTEENIIKVVPLDGDKFTIGWNVQDLAKMVFNIDVVGKQAPMLGDFEFHRNLKWNDLSGDAFELVWDGTAASNMMRTTPIKTDAKIAYKNGELKIKMEKKFNSKTFALIFNTTPFKFAVLPFFEM